MTFVASFRARLIRSITSRYIRGMDLHKAEVNLVRRRMDVIARLARPARRVDIEETRVCDLKAEWLRPEGARAGKVLLYLHGGAYVLGSCKSHRHLVSHIARAGKINALLPEYRLAPEHPFPAGLDDCVAVYRALLADGIAPQDIIVGGDSAGGGLTVALMLALRHAGDPLPRAGLLLSPFLDMTASGESAESRLGQDPWFDPADIDILINYYCGDSEVRNPLVSPVFANVAGLPPFFIQVGDDEILLSDATRFADKMRDSGNKVAIEIWPEMWHVWQLFVGKMPEARQAIAKIGEFISGTFADGPAVSAGK